MRISDKKWDEFEKLGEEILELVVLGNPFRRGEFK
jgi:hypothetical protein